MILTRAAGDVIARGEPLSIHAIGGEVWFVFAALAVLAVVATVAHIALPGEEES
jgi:hypothetical protein